MRAKLRGMFMSRGPGFRRIAQAHAGAAAADTLVAMALAGTLFFDVPSTEARNNVALYLLITLAPFAVIGPFLGSFYDRFPGAYRAGMVFSTVVRALLALVMAIWLDSFALFPLAFFMLVLSRLFGISRSSLLPVVLASPTDLISANAQIAKIGIFGSAVAAPIGALCIWAVGSWFTLLVVAVALVYAAASAAGLPSLDVAAPRTFRGENPEDLSATGYHEPPQSVRLARFATAGGRFLNGFLLLLVAFTFRDADAGVYDFGALLVAAGAGYFLAALTTPVLNKYVSEEPMLIVGLAVEAAAAFVAAQAFNLAAAAFLSTAAGFAWGTAKFGFDGLLQATMSATDRGRTFTASETFFQFSWVVGALIPIVPGASVGFLSLPSLSVEIGLISAGLIALLIQIVYVSAVLGPVVAERRRSNRDIADTNHDDGDVMDLFN